MAGNFNVEKKGTKTVLVAPLDWGLGHTTRCIPIIKEQMSLGHRVILAGNTSQLRVFSEEFPGLESIPLEGYGIKYGKTRAGTIFRLFTQLPRLQYAIQREHEWLKKIVTEYPIDTVISDNRYGLYHPSLHSILITHQLAIRPPLGSWGASWLKKWSDQRLQSFHEIWVPDFADATNSLAGELSHPPTPPPVPVRYIGPLSRFRHQPVIPVTPSVLILLSGPEPARSIWEEKLLRQIAVYPGAVTLVRGLPTGGPPLPSLPRLTVHDHLPSATLEKTIAAARFVIARAGYSTLMDLTVMQKNAILVPTPGQSEQEYLAGYVKKKKRFYTVAEKNFRLEDDLKAAEAFFNT